MNAKVSYVFSALHIFYKELAMSQEERFVMLSCMAAGGRGRCPPILLATSLQRHVFLIAKYFEPVNDWLKQTLPPPLCIFITFLIVQEIHLIFDASFAIISYMAPQGSIKN